MSEYIKIAEAAARIGVCTQSIYKGKRYRAYISKKGFDTRYFETEQPSADKDTTCNQVTNCYQPLTTPEKSTAELVAELRREIEQLNADKAFLQDELIAARKEKAEMRLLLNAEQQKTAQLLSAGNVATVTNPVTNHARPRETPQEATKKPQGNNSTKQHKTAQRPPQPAPKTKPKRRGLFGFLFEPDTAKKR